jgi:tRNA(fMet)-specific endonuclease VapC
LDYILDTNALTALMAKDSALDQQLSVLTANDRLMTCVIAEGELLAGIARLAEGRRKAELRRRAEQVLAEVISIPLSNRTPTLYAELKAESFRIGRPMSDNDLWIAAVALEYNAVLVTRDKDFEAIANLVRLGWA